MVFRYCLTLHSTYQHTTRRQTYMYIVMHSTRVTKHATHAVHRITMNIPPHYAHNTVYRTHHYTTHGTQCIDHAHNTVHLTHHYTTHTTQCTEHTTAPRTQHNTPNTPLHHAHNTMHRTHRCTTHTTLGYTDNCYIYIYTTYMLVVPVI